MTNPVVMFCLVASFWVLMSIGLWWQEKSWFPFTVMAPLLLLGVAVLIDKIAPGWGTRGVSVIHIVLWGMLSFITIGDTVRSRKKDKPSK